MTAGEAPIALTVETRLTNTKYRFFDGQMYRQSRTWFGKPEWLDGEIESELRTEDTHAEAVAKAQEIADSMLIVDDSLWRVTPEPVYVVDRHGLRVCLDGWWEGLDPALTFRVDEFDQARQKAADINLSKKASASIADMTPPVTVLNHDAVRTVIVRTSESDIRDQQLRMVSSAEEIAFLLGSPQYKLAGTAERVDAAMRELAEARKQWSRLEDGH